MMQEPMSFQKLVDDFKTLNSENRINALNGIIESCGTNELNYLSERLEDFLKRDFLRFLPTELCTYLLSFLDDSTLGKCCRVSKTWNAVVSNSQLAWMRCCQSVGWKIDESIKDGRYWKKIYYQALERKQQLKEGTAFQHNTLVGHTARVYTVKYDGYGHLASGSDDRHIRLWDTTSGECLQVIKAHACADLAFNQFFVLTASFDNTIARWNWDTGHCVRTYYGHTGAVFSIDFDEDHDLLVSGSADKTVRLWQLSTGEQVNMLHGHTEWVTKVILDKCKVESIHHKPYDDVILSMDKLEIRLWSINHEVNADSIHVFTIHNERPEHSTSDFFLLPQMIFTGQNILCSSERGIIEWNFTDYSLRRVIPHSNSCTFLIGVGDTIYLTADTIEDCLLMRVCDDKINDDVLNLQKLNSQQNGNFSDGLNHAELEFECVRPSTNSISNNDDPVELEIVGDQPNQVQNANYLFQPLHFEAPTNPMMRMLSSPNEYSPTVDNDALVQNKHSLPTNSSLLSDVIGHCKLPSLRWSKRGSNFACGNSAWTNGFTHDNNKGLVFAAALPNHSIYLVNWKD